MLSPCHVMLASIQATSQVQIPVSLHFRLTVKQKLVGCLQLAGALGRVHMAGLVHNDVRSGNVLVGCKEQNWLLADFGSATEYSISRTDCL